MGRYSQIKIIKDMNTKKRRFVSTIYPKIPLRDSDLYIHAREGDRMDNLAYRYYDDPEKWWIIAHANHIGKGTLAIEPGLQIRIPVEIAEIIDSFIDFNKNNGYAPRTNNK